MSQPDGPAYYETPSVEPVAVFTPVVTYATIALNVAVFFVMVARGVGFVDPTAEQVLPWGANFGPLTASGQWWRLLTACYLHFGIIHIGMNMYVLWQVGPFAEKLYGRARYLLLYLAAGVGGNLAGLYIHPLTVAAGASGAIFGVYGGVLGFLLVRRNVIATERAWAIAKSAGIFLAYNLIYGVASVKTDLTAHVGGLIVGFVVGCLLAWAGPEEPMRLLAAVAAIALALAGAVTKAPRVTSTQAEELMGVADGATVTVGQNDRVIYSGDATKADAESLAKALVLTRVFASPNVTLLLSKEEGKTTISLSLKGDETQSGANGKPLPWKSPSFLLYLREIGPVLASAAGGPPLDIELDNKKGERRGEVEIDAGAVMINASDSVGYAGMATAAEAKAMGDALVAAGYMNGQGSRPLLTKDEHGTVVTYYFKDATVQNPDLWKDMEIAGRKIAPVVGGLPLTMHLLGTSGTVSKDILVQ
ncbi:rhomboid family intramembrane serine protease [Granulicella rosea]|nr:rhomboid family intramembrane serine protease [Granulicella rosea]